MSDDRPMKGLVSIENLAVYLDVCEDTVESWVERGIIPPPLRLGDRTRRWRLRDVDKWIDEHNNAPKLGSIADATRKAMERH